MDKNFIINQIKAELGNEIDVLFKDMQKNNVTLPAIAISSDERVSMVIYYDTTDTDEKIVNDVVSTYRINKNNSQLISDISENIGKWDYIKDKVIPVLYNVNMNNYNDRPTTVLAGDIGVYFRAILAEEMSIAVTKAMLDAWDANIDELFMYATENLNKHIQYVDIMMLMMGAYEGKGRIIDPSNPVMNVLITDNKQYGAAGMLLLNRLITNGEIEKQDYIIIPSSIHECILLPADDGTTSDVLKNMIESVNKEEVAPTEVLSNSPYIYKAKTGIIELFA